MVAIIKKDWFCWALLSFLCIIDLTGSRGNNYKKRMSGTSDIDRYIAQTHPPGINYRAWFLSYSIGVHGKFA